MTTESNSSLDRKIAYLERTLAKIDPAKKPHSFAWYTKSLEYHRTQRSLPQADRCQFRHGSL